MYLWFTLCAIVVNIHSLQCMLNERPIIGVLEQEWETTPLSPNAFIAAPNVKWVEMGGARVIPIEIKRDEHYYRDVVNRTNGLLFPGGGRDIMDSYFSDAAEMLFDYAMDANDRGEYYPIWGVCQGLEILSVLIVKKYLHNGSHSDNWLMDCNADDMALNLEFNVRPNTTQLFANAPGNIIEMLSKDNLAANYHHQCLSPKNFSDSKLSKHLRIVTTSRDADGLAFVSTFESANVSRPMFGLQWHPEKIPFEFSVVSKRQNPDAPQENIPHSYNGVLMAQFMANVFVNHTRRNGHSFDGLSDVNKVIIYNYNPRFTLKDDGAEDKGETFSQIYEFFGSSTRKPCSIAKYIWAGIGIGILLTLVVVFICTWCQKDDSSKTYQLFN